MLCGGGARSTAGCQAPAPGEAALARNRTLRTSARRAWGREAPEPAAGLGHRSGAPAAPADSQEGREEEGAIAEFRTVPRPPIRSAPPPATPHPGLSGCLGSFAPSGRPAGVDKSPTCTASPAMSSGRPPGVPAPRHGLRARERARREARHPDPP